MLRCYALCLCLLRAKTLRLSSRHSHGSDAPLLVLFREVTLLLGCHGCLLGRCNLRGLCNAIFGNALATRDRRSAFALEEHRLSLLREISGHSIAPLHDSQARRHRAFLCRRQLLRYQRLELRLARLEVVDAIGRLARRVRSRRRLLGKLLLIHLLGERLGNLLGLLDALLDQPLGHSDELGGGALRLLLRFGRPHVG